MDIDFGKLIKDYREKNYISQKEFAELLGFSFVSINRWENGHFSPTLKAKRKLNKFFKEKGFLNE